jgi:hypothetical protein
VHSPFFFAFKSLYNTTLTCRANLCDSIHILLYPSVLLLDNSIKYLIRHGSDTLEESVSSKACWTVSAALSAALVCMTIATLLNRCLDGPGTLLISNRYIRLAPRAMLVVVLMCLPIKTDITTGSFLLIIMVLMLVINFWEHVVALEKGGRLFEPKEATD